MGRIEYTYNLAHGLSLMPEINDKGHFLQDNGAISYKMLKIPFGLKSNITPKLYHMRLITEAKNHN
jgi:hypothetical protein